MSQNCMVNGVRGCMCVYIYIYIIHIYVACKYISLFNLETALLTGSFLCLE